MLSIKGHSQVFCHDHFGQYRSRRKGSELFLCLHWLSCPRNKSGEDKITQLSKVTMGDERKITDCEHFLHGTCTFADACFYRHPMKLREPAIVCKFWQSYSCVNYYCQFLHPAVIPPQPAYTPRLVAEPTAKASIVCAYYMSGRCSKPSCPFMHSLPDATNSRHPQCKFLVHLPEFWST